MNPVCHSSIFPARRPPRDARPLWDCHDAVRPGPSARTAQRLCDVVALATAALALVVQDATSLAPIGLFVFGAAVLLIGDNFVQPALIGGTAELPFLLVLIGILGGMQSFGLVGLFLGPVIMAALLTVWREWFGVRE